MDLPSLFRKNTKSLFFHMVVVVVAGVVNTLVWGGSTSAISPLEVFLFSLGIYFILGMLMTDYGSFSSNAQSIAFLPLVSFLLYAGTLIPSSNFEGSFVNFLDLLFFVHIQPFLYFAGIPAKFDYPLLYSIVPALALFIGMQCKVMIMRVKDLKGAGRTVKKGEGS